MDWSLDEVVVALVARRVGEPVAGKVEVVEVTLGDGSASLMSWLPIVVKKAFFEAPPCGQALPVVLTSLSQRQ